MSRSEERPWLQHYGDCPARLEYPPVTLFGALQKAAKAHPRALALRFLGSKLSFASLLDQVLVVSKGLRDAGFKPGDRVLVCLPNTPHAVIILYALNHLGAVSAMIHPLSTSAEIDEFRRVASCTKTVLLDAFYKRFAELVDQGHFASVVVCRIAEYLKPPMKLAFWLSKGRKIPAIPAHPALIPWSSLIKAGTSATDRPGGDPLKHDEMALILFSGGTTGEPKGIMLSSRNCNALAMQTAASGGPIEPGDSILSILPVFHGFGLAVGIHTILIHAGTAILVPTFTPASVAKLIKKWRPQFMAGVPTLFDALAGSKVFRSADLSSFKGIFVGGDSLSREIKDRFEAVLKQSRCQVALREGYGLTESVTANMLMPRHEYRERSIGVPYPDMMAKIVRIDGFDELPCGEEGEICVRGPSVMLGYLDHPEETAQTLRLHPDGQVWLHTGDSGTMDAEGFFYFRQRLKRIIKSSGISVYPAHVEEVLSRHPAVRMVCVIGVPHHSQGHVPQAYVVANPGVQPSDELGAELVAWCRKELMPHSCPRTIVFRDSLPLTLVGKVAYRQLEKELAQ